MNVNTTLRLNKLSADQHYQFIAQQKSASFLQSPDWTQTKSEWRGESLGWWDNQTLVAAATVLYRPIPVPGLRNRVLAYIADGPVFDPNAVELAAIMTPLIPYLRGQGAFLARVGLPFVLRRWDAAEVRTALSKGTHARLTDLEPVETNATAQSLQDTLRQLGWQAPELTEDFAAGQPIFQARVPLPVLDPKYRQDREAPEFQVAVDSVLKQMNSSSRNETRRSTRSEVVVWEGTDADVDAWQGVYEETARRENFRPRPAEYFATMYRALNASPTAQCRFLFAQYQDQILAAAIFVQQQDTSWYLYGGSTRSESKRFAPRALQLEQIKLSLEAGVSWYDHGGVSLTLDKTHPLAGLTRFKTTMGADVVQTMGEWDLPLNKVLAKVFNLYMARRG